MNRMTQFLPLVALLSCGPTLADSSLTACRHIQSDADRLICYDRLVDQEYGQGQEAVTATGQMDTPADHTEKHEPTVRSSDVSDATTPPRQAPPYRPRVASKPVNTSVPKQADDAFGRPRQLATDLDEVSSSVTSVTKGPYDKLIITLDSGQVWHQINSRRFRLESGDQVTITSGRLDSYQLRKVGASLSIRVRRVDQ